MTDALHRCEGMSSERWEEPSSRARPEETGLEKQQGEVEEKEEVCVPCQDRQLVGSLTLEEELPKRCLSPDHSGRQEVASKGRVERARREKMQKKRKFSCFKNSQRRKESVSGVRLVDRFLRRSFPRGTSTCSFPHGDGEQHTDEPRGSGPFYFFGGANGAKIVSSYCESRGWKRIYNKKRDDFKLKWCETKSAANYGNFREGEQLVFQIPNNAVLTTKIGLLCSLREYERVSSKVNHGQGLRRLKMDEFLPATFRMDVKAEREAFFAQQEGVSDSEGRMWICKPTGLNQGRGIFLLKSREDVLAFRQKLQLLDRSQDGRKMLHRRPQACIVQRYIQKPLLLNGRKFDVRSYLLIACTSPHMVFFRHGYVRLTCNPYDPDSNSLCTHLTNQYMQKKSPLYSQLKEDTVWSMESFNAYVNDRFRVARGLPRDWVLCAFTKRMQQIMTQCFLAVKTKLERRLGLFDLIGCDFMVDEDFKVWLLEMNCNPALHTNCEVLKEVVPRTVVETLDLSLEIFYKCRLKRSILPLASQRDFLLLYNGVNPSESTCSKKNTSRESNQKNTKTFPKAGTTRCKSGPEGKIASLASPNSTSTPAGHPECPGVQTLNKKNPRLQVELKPSKCTLIHHLRANDHDAVCR